jgi:molecular chaperone GrpE
MEEETKKEQVPESEEAAPVLEVESVEVETVEAEPLEVSIEKLLSELEAAQNQALEYLDGWQRARADYANYRKRMERDQVLANQTATGNIIKRFLEILDDLDRALLNRPTEGEGATWAAGIELIQRKFNNILETEGVKPIQAEGEYFDPNQHEAISQEENPDLESGQIIATVQQGYLYGDRVLRPARVRVTR